MIIVFFEKKNKRFSDSWGGGEGKNRFFNYRRIEWNFVLFCKKLSISPISKVNVNFSFQNWITCWEDLQNIFLVFPIVHQYVNLTTITYRRNEKFSEHFFKILINFPDTWHQSTYQNQSVSYMSVNFTKKNHFFGSRFFKFHRHVIRFSCKKREKKDYLLRFS